MNKEEAKEELLVNKNNYPSVQDVGRVNDRGIACIPNDSPLTIEELENIAENGFINYTTGGP